MTTLTESTHRGEHIVSEAEGSRSRDPITILSGRSLAAAVVLGAVLAGAATPAAAAGNTGNGTIGAVTTGVGVKAGVYQLTCVEPATDGGVFSVEDPDGVALGVAEVGTEFTGGGLTFTIADGATDFVAGDAFTITVAEGSGKYVQLDLTATDGSEVAKGILYDAVDASSADAPGVAHLRDCEVNAAELVWPDGITTNQKTAALAQLAELGIIAR